MGRMPNGSDPKARIARHDQDVAPTRALVFTPPSSRGGAY